MVKNIPFDISGPVVPAEGGADVREGERAGAPLHHHRVHPPRTLLFCQHTGMDIAYMFVHHR